MSVSNPYAPYVDSYEAIVSWEEHGVSTLDEAIAVARAIITTGLYRSAGRYGRFLSDVAEELHDHFTTEQVEAILVDCNDELLVTL